jgi:hypothetical protein
MRAWSHRLEVAWKLCESRLVDFTQEPGRQQFIELFAQIVVVGTREPHQGRLQQGTQLGIAGDDRLGQREPLDRDGEQFARDHILDGLEYNTLADIQIVRIETLAQ